MAELPVRCGMVSVSVLRRHENAVQLLLLQRQGGYLEGVWSYVGGHVEAGETGEEAARRELREETGLTPEILWATSFCEQFFDASGGCIQLVPAFVVWAGEQDRIRLNAEHSACRWCSLEEAMDVLPFGSQRELLLHLQREFVQRKPHPVLALGGQGGG